MAERLLQFEQNPKETLIWTLKKFGFEVPLHPNPNYNYPQQWLVRGETRTDRLINAYDFIPQTGAMGAFGVFFGDAIDPLMCCTNGIYYIYNRETLINGKIVLFPSDDYKELLKKIAQEHNLSFSGINDTLEMESILFHEHYVYQNESGVFTVPCSVPINAVNAIIVPKDIKENLSERISPLLEKKVFIH